MQNLLEKPDIKEFLGNLETINEKLNAIIENSFDGIYITDGKANTILVNRNYEIITGLSRENMLGKNMADLVQDRVISVSGTLMVLDKRRPVTLEQEFETGKKALITSSPVFDKNGEITMVVTNVRDLTEIYQLQEEVERKNILSIKARAELDEFLKKINNYKDIVCIDKNSVAILQLIDLVAGTDATVMLMGETGVGKDVFAQYIYENSKRKDKPFVRVNCGALSSSLIESELFGYEKGSFTGANREGKIGLFEVADEGTIFLDEIGELPPEMQVKLLRVLQDQEVMRIGGRNAIKIDVRIIAATNRNLEELVKEKKFREDLYYRLTVFPVLIPPLRERIYDITPLAELFVRDLNEKYGFKKTLLPSTLKLLQSYNYPGNIRELKNIIERAFIISNETSISVKDIPISIAERYYESTGYLLRETREEEPGEEGGVGIDLKKKMAEIELDYINAAYKKYKNIRAAASSLGMDPSTFLRKRKKSSQTT
ncbi:MAG: sigma 54-interacting transcriptional regulator [Fusobacteriaceae bacterium]|jgi:PAS domain S-box-containing protein|nr:sigma 54-interacting transcriptional regulator [Fusobacteriaceae bacterium]